MLWMICLSLGALFPSVSSGTIKLIVVVDEPMNKFPENLQNAVSYVNKPSSGLLGNHTLQLEVVVSQDNDSYGAMEQVCAHMQSGAAMIVDFSSRYVTTTLRSMAEAMGITHVSAVDPSFVTDGRTYNTSLNVEPPASYMLRCIRDIVAQENLTNVGIIYDETFDLEHKPKRLLSNIPAQHLYLQMNPERIPEQLEKIKSAELSHLFLVSSHTNAKAFLEEASEKRMMSFKYTWYVLTKDGKVQCSQCMTKTTAVVILANIPGSSMRNEYLSYINSQLTTHQIDHEDIEVAAVFQWDLIMLLAGALQQAYSEGWFSQINYTDCFEWNSTDLVAYSQAASLRNKIIQSKFLGILGPIRFRGSQGELSMGLNINRNEYQNGISVNEKRVGNWSRAQRLNAFYGSLADKTAKKTYRVITISQEPPFVFRLKEKPKFDEKTGKEHYTYYNKTSGYYYFGYCIDLIYHINKSLEFDFVLLEPPDNRYGSMQPNGSWDGMINELVQDRADIIVAPLSVMAERENVIDFTVPYYDLVGITILMKKPTFEYTVFKFMSVLEEEVWACVFSAFILVSILLWLFDKYSPYSYQNNKDTWDGQGEEPRIFTLKEGLWFCMTSLTPQGGGEAPRALSGRLVAATWWMFGFIMIATYTANLAAFLTVSRLDQPIESLDDLAKQFKTKYAPQTSSSTQTYFMRMRDIEDKFYSIWKRMSLNDSLDQVERAKLAVWDYPVSDKFTNMWEAMKTSGFPSSFVEAKQRILTEEFAFIGDATQNKYATLTECSLWEVGEEFSRKPYALAVQEGSPLKNEISSVILQLLNRRVLEDLKSQWWEYNRTKCAKIEDESDGISIYNIGGVFIVIFIGIGLGLVTLAFEFYWYKWRPGAQKSPPPNAITVKEAQTNGAFDVKE